MPDRYWGFLSKAGSVPDTGAAARPWPAIAPEEFVTPPDSQSPVFQAFPGTPRGAWARVMSPGEAALLSLSNIAGGFEGLHLVGPNDETIYSFSLWPMFPEETSPPPVESPSASAL